jgi:tripartite-type tricarboxylate transporter receptor subunit TctC
MRMISRFAVIVSLMVCAGASHAAETYPSKPGRLILPFGAGASTDIIGRIFAQRFSEAWGQTLVVDNRPGAGGTLGTAIASKAAPDGYTIFTYGINQAITPNLYKNLPYDPLRDFIPVSLYATMPNILCINPSLPAGNAGEFIKLVKANPGKYKYGSSGVGASPHLTMELFKAMAGIDLVHIPYKAAGQAYIETMTGQIQAFFFNLPGQARGAGARCAHHHGIRHTGFRSDGVARLRHAQGHIEGSPGQDPRGDDESAGFTRVEAALF